MFDVIKYSTYFNIHLFKKKTENSKKKHTTKSKIQKKKYVKRRNNFPLHIMHV